LDNTEALKQAEEKSRLGDKFRDFEANGVIATLEDHIFKPFEQVAFEEFKKVDPANTAQVIWAQMMSSVVDEMRRKIDSIISEGQKAKEDIKNYNEELNDG
jgi:hypothetical protein